MDYIFGPKMFITVPTESSNIIRGIQKISYFHNMVSKMVAVYTPYRDDNFWKTRRMDYNFGPKMFITVPKRKFK